MKGAGVLNESSLSAKISLLMHLDLIPRRKEVGGEELKVGLKSRKGRKRAFCHWAC